MLRRMSHETIPTQGTYLGDFVLSPMSATSVRKNKESYVEYVEYLENKRKLGAVPRQFQEHKWSGQTRSHV